MNTVTVKKRLDQYLFERLSLELVPAGYRPRMPTVRKAANDVALFVVLYRLPKSGPDQLEVICEATAYSADLNRKLGFADEDDWADSQIRVRLDDFRPRPDKYLPPWTCSNEQEADRVFDELRSILFSSALPIIEAISSSEDIVRMVREGRHTPWVRSLHACDAAVWEGTIYPVQQPFVAPPPEPIPWKSGSSPSEWKIKLD